MEKLNVRTTCSLFKRMSVLLPMALLLGASLSFGLNVTSYVTNTDGITFTCNSPYSASFEAEAATLSGSAGIATNHTGYSGTGFVDGYINSTTAQTLITVTAPSAGQYQVQLRYSAGNGASANTALYVNGTQIRTISCPVTVDWNTWAVRTDTVTLNSGSNTIAYRAVTSANACINLDVITVTSIGGTGGTSLMKVQICQADIVHLTYTPTSSFPSKTQLVVTRTWPTPSFTTSDAGDTITLQTGRIKVKVSRSTANVTYSDLSNAVITSENTKSASAATVEGVSTYTISTTFNSPADEGLYGLGQHMIDGGSGTVIVNYKGQNELLDQWYGNPRFYTAIPVLVSTRGYGIYWDNYSKSWFYGGDAGNTQYRYVSECGAIIDYYFFYGPNLDTVISKYRTTTGKTPLFPKWCYGLIQSRDRYTSQSDFIWVMNGYRNNNIPLDCIVQDWHYWDGAGQQGCYCFNSNWTDVRGMITTMHNANLHTMLSIWSQLEQGSPPFNTFNTNGWLWPSDGTTRFIDAYSSGAREAFWTNIYNAFFNPGVQGWDAWWLDNDEPFPYPNGFDRHALVTAMGKGCLYYNTYTLMMTAMGYKNWRRDIPGKRFVILHRACFAGQQAHGGMSWNNDINCDFGTLANSVPSGLNSTITGVPYWCTDIGGYWGHSLDWSTAANRELFTRWFQYGAFQPVFRIHGGGSRELFNPWGQWDATTQANLVMIDKLHYRLMPYIYAMAWMVTNQDYTPMRHLVMDFRTDANVKSIGNQYMFGPAFMVSPVTTQGATSRSVYLPAGTWYDFWTGATNTGAAGRTITASAPLSQIPLYVRAGSIVPMGQEIQYATQRSDTIELRVYPGADGQFTLYEDEGDNYNYETGSYATIPFTYNNTTGKITIGPRNGSFTGMLQNRIFAIVFVTSGHGTGEPKTVNPDCIVNYSGTGVTACPAVGVCASCGSARAKTPKPVTLKTAQERIVLSHEFSGKTIEISLYDCSGRLLQKIVTGKHSVDIRKDFGLPGGVYIVHIKVIR